MKGELSGDLEGGFTIEYLARVAVHPIGQAVHITLRERREGLYLWAGSAE